MDCHGMYHCQCYTVNLKCFMNTKEITNPEEPTPYVYPVNLIFHHLLRRYLHSAIPAQSLYAIEETFHLCCSSLCIVSRGLVQSPMLAPGMTSTTYSLWLSV